jgi:endonuclease/exonuclease/phosphatase family metal-dependent hydrolase
MRKRAFMLAALLAALTFVAGAADAGKPLRKFQAGPINVMTQNLYVGGDILLPLSVPPEQFPAAAALVIEQIIATSFPERAMALADEMLARRPDLVGLQEVYVVKVCLEAAPQICPLDQDYLELLLDNLNADKPLYRAASTVTNISLANLPATLPDGTGVRVSLTDRDVILARAGVATRNPVSANFAARLPVDNPALPPGFAVIRGYTMVDATVAGREYRFLNTHLEVSGAGSTLEPVFRAIQAAQALELVSPGGPLFSDDHTQVVVGDFNSSPFEGPIVPCLIPTPSGLAPGQCPTPYAVLANFRYIDTWLERVGRWELGNTCCQAALLDNEESELYERIDLTWVRPAPDHYGGPGVRAVRAEVVGEEIADKTPGGLWPSDHAGVATRIILRTPR